MDNAGENTKNRQLVRIDVSLSRTLYVLKALAIVCVVMAHCSYTNELTGRISSLFGTLGVPIFLIISGFLFQRNENSRYFWKKKLTSIIVPWVTWGVITYFFAVTIENKSISFLSLIGWIFGNMTWLYFVPILLMCFVLCRFSERVLWHLVLAALFVFSNILTITGSISGVGIVTKYQNVFNWIGFFQLGILLRKTQFLKKLVELPHLMKIVLSLVWLICSVLFVAEMMPTYWTPYSIAYELLSAVVLFLFAEMLNGNRLLVALGKDTYPIYFVHMNFGIGAFSIIVRLLNIAHYEWIMLFVKPFSIVLAVWGGIYLTRLLAKRLRIGRILWLFGMK